MIYMTMKFGEYDVLNGKFLEWDTADFVEDDTVDSVLAGFLENKDCKDAQLVLVTPAGETVLGNFYQKKVKSGRDQYWVWKVREA